MRLRKTRTTVRSPEVKGDVGNFSRKVRFDLTGGYVGINQWRDEIGPMDRVLLSPDQVQALVRFVTVKHATR